MKLFNLHKSVNIEFKESFITKIEKIALKHYPNEFGGFLVGYYTSDFKTLMVTDFLIPQEYKSYRTLFRRSTKGIKDKLLKLFYTQKKLYYVGEWHTHPNLSTKYSSTDLNAMKNIAESNLVRIENPVLLILSIDKEKIKNYTFYMYDNKKLFKYGEN